MKQYDEALQKKLSDYIDGLGPGGQKKAASELGYSEALISTYRKSTYHGNVAGIENRLREFFQIQEQSAELYFAPEYIPTSISEGVYSTIRMCHLNGSLANEYGDAGIGKTKAAEKYVRDYPNSAVLVTVNPCFANVNACLKLICWELGIPAGRKDEMWKNIYEHLRGGRKVLIIDEAQHLPIKTIDTLRSFSDANKELGIVLIGNPIAIANADNPRYKQIKNRTKLPSIRRTTDVTLDDIQKLFPDLKDCPKELEFLHAVARSEQGVRGTMNLYINARNNENTTIKGLMAMAKTMQIIAS